MRAVQTKGAGTFGGARGRSVRWPPRERRTVLETVMLTLFPLLFLLVYLGFCWLTKEASDSERSVMEIAGFFVFSLVPIAIAYHLTHYLSYLLLAGQLIIPLASDPFGIGWDLFGTAGHCIDISIIGAKFVLDTPGG